MRAKRTKETTFIYALRNPKTEKIFYIGKSDDPKKRLSNHLHDTRKYFNIPILNRLLKEMLDDNYEPELIVLDEVQTSEWEEKEQFYIAQHKERGLELLNLTTGGKAFGIDCVKRSARNNSKPIIQYTLQGCYIKEYVSIREASRQLNCAKSSIYASLNTKHKTAKGFYWRFKIGDTVEQTIVTKPRSYTTKPVYMILPNGDNKKWNSVREAAKELGVYEGALSTAIRKGKKIKGFKVEKDMSCKRWHKPHGKLIQKVVNYALLDPTEYSQFNK